LKQILITGANGQLGSFLAKEYHQEGYSVVLLYHKRKERIAGILSDPRVQAASLDLSDYDLLCRVINEMQVSPSALIHCASLRSYDAKPLAETRPETFLRVLDTNLHSAYNILRVILPLMQENGQGRVVLLGSDVTRSGLKNGSAYGAAKAGMVNLVKSVAKEVAKFGVCINAISPAPVETVLEEDFVGQYLEFRKDYFTAYLKRTPTGKLVSLEEIKRVTDMLIDNKMINLNGQEIFLDGGSL
jgi:NAD(P)-dependent dehydrogenase (short-subunit alcohol dehydrogenase family)